LQDIMAALILYLRKIAPLTRSFIRAIRVCKHGGLQKVKMKTTCANGLAATARSAPIPPAGLNASFSECPGPAVSKPGPSRGLSISTRHFYREEEKAASTHRDKPGTQS